MLAKRNLQKKKKNTTKFVDIAKFYKWDLKRRNGKKTFQQDMSEKKQQKKYSANFTTNYNLKVCMKNEDIGQM